MTAATTGPPIATLPPLADPPGIAVVIPARDAADTLGAAIGSALAQDPRPDEVVVALGPSTDDTAVVARSLAAEHPRVRVVDNPEGGTSTGLNAAIAASQGQVIARLDAHARLPPGYLDVAVTALRDTQAGNVGGIQVPTAGTGFAQAVAAAMRSPVGSGGAAYRSAASAGPADTVYLGVFRREALDAVGGFDPRFVRNQDAELNLRLRAAGYEVWLEPSLRVTYRPRGDVGALARQYLQYGRWRRLTAQKHPGSLRLRQLVPPVVVAALAGAAVVSLVTRRVVPLGVAAGGYAATVTAAGVQAAPSSRDVPATALALATMHMSWGVGFLVGPPSGGASSGGSTGGWLDGSTGGSTGGSAG